MSIFLFFLACGEKQDTTTTITDISQFDQSCEVDEDCILVIEGDVCGCGCDYAGINSAEQRPWTEYYNGLYASCDPAMIPDCAACPPAVAFCNDGTCQAEEDTSE